MRPAESSTTCDRNASGADNGGFYDTRDDHEKLIRRPKDVQDNAIPSGSAMATHVLLKLDFLTADTTYWDAAKQATRSVGKLMAQYPSGFGEWLNAASLIMGESREIALVGNKGQVAPLLGVVRTGYWPLQVGGRRRGDRGWDGSAAGKPAAGERLGDRLRVPALRLRNAGYRSAKACSPAEGASLLANVRLVGFESGQELRLRALSPGEPIISRRTLPPIGVTTATGWGRSRWRARGDLFSATRPFDPVPESLSNPRAPRSLYGNEKIFQLRRPGCHCRISGVGPIF